MVKVLAREVRVGDVVEHEKAFVEVLAVAQVITGELKVQLAGIDQWATWDRDHQVEVFDFNKGSAPSAVEAIQFTVDRNMFTHMLAAFYVCQPSGGGGPEMSLVTNLAAQANIELASDEFHKLLQRYCQNVVQDAVDAGAAAWLEGGAA